MICIGVPESTTNSLSSCLIPVREIDPATVFVFWRTYPCVLGKSRAFCEFPRCFSCLFFTMSSPLLMQILICRGVRIAIILSPSLDNSLRWSFSRLRIVSFRIAFPQYRSYWERICLAVVQNAACDGQKCATLRKMCVRRGVLSSISGLENKLFFLPLPPFGWRAWNSPILDVCGCVEVWLSCRRKYSRCQSFAFGGAFSTCCCLLQVVRALPLFTICFSKGTWSLFGPLAIRSRSFTFASVISSDWRCTRYRSSSRYRSRILVLPFFSWHSWGDHALCDTIGSFRSDQLFPPRFSNSSSKCSCRRYFETIHNLFWKLVPWLRHLLLDVPVNKWNTCVQGFHHGNTSGIL